jgi:putative thioredoxin
MFPRMKSQSAPAAGTAPGAVIEVDERNFEQEVLARSQQTPVVIDFWAPWCGPCRTLGPTLERLAAEAKGAWVLAKVNVDENPRLSQAFRVQSIPAVMAVSAGKVVDQFVGALPESQVRAWLKRFVKEQEQGQGQGGSLLDAARELEATDPEGAAARYRLILGEEPENAEALFALGRLLLLQGTPEGVAALKQVPAGSPQFARAQAALPLADFIAEADGPDAGELDARYRKAARATRSGDYASAVDDLLAVVARDRAFRDDGARKALLALFAALGDEHAAVPAGRRRLANTLF